MRVISIHDDQICMTGGCRKAWSATLQAFLHGYCTAEHYVECRLSTRRLSHAPCATRSHQFTWSSHAVSATLIQQPAALFTLAEHRGIEMAMAFAVRDSLADLVWHPQVHAGETGLSRTCVFAGDN